MPDPPGPSFDLVVATVDRPDALRQLLRSLERQSYRRFRVVLVDQSDDESARAAAAGSTVEVVHVRAPRGLSRARNAGIVATAADVLAFPDDDCEYPPDLLERVAALLASRPDLAGVSGRTADASGHASGRWHEEPGPIDRENVWHRVNSAALFLRRPTVLRIGGFDERLGLGSPEPWSSGEEVDLVVRAVDAGAVVEFDPSLVVLHPQPDLPTGQLAAIGRRDGASVGYVLRRHGYARGTVARMLVRPAGGAALSLLRGDVRRARFHAATLRGRLQGYRRAA
ncbi:MAG TPA: glycosyltransferase family A protein [Gaiellaceae bacterium]|nr:glycosyltransferase family A protein [Gaiellaceae bacterium]